MHFNERFLSSINKLKTDPLDQKAAFEIGAEYWFWLSDTLCSLFREKKNIGAFLKENSDLIDFGIHSSLVSTNQTRLEICDCELSSSSVPVITVSQWITDLILRIRQGSEKLQLEKEIRLHEIQKHRLEGEVLNLQKKRRERIESAPEVSNSKLEEKMETMDNLQFEIFRTKKDMVKGVFLTAQQRRDHHDREKQFEKDLKTAAVSFSSVADKEFVADVRKISKMIEQLFSKIIESEIAIREKKAEIESLRKKTSVIHITEIENGIKREIDDLRSSVKLSAKRENLSDFPLVRPGDKFFSFKTLKSSLEQIMEFDPHIFRNSRVQLFGKPYVLLVPGRGSAVYDWKINCIILPLIAPGGNFMASLARGMIDYRLEVDESRMLLNSFNQLPDLKNVRSFAQQKSQLIRDYIIWMTSEFKGHRILSKTVKDWFEREIAPSQSEIWAPFEYQWYSLNSAEYKEKLASLAPRIENPSLSDIEDLWAASILYYQKGDFSKSAELLSALVQKKPNHLMAWYNLGFISLKNLDPDQAKHAFGIFCSMNPQSWWARVAQNHMRNL